MKKIEIFAWLFIIGFANNLQGQFTQVELFSGFAKTDFALYSSSPVNRSKTLHINTLAFIQNFRDKENKEFDEIGVQPTLFWKINKNIAIGPSLYYNSIAGYSGRFSAKFTFKKSRAIMVITPTIAYSEQTDSLYAETLAQFQWNTPLNEKISLWFSGQLLTVMDSFRKHSRSFQQIRTGLSFKGHQTGLGVDLDQYGPKPKVKFTFGIYYRKLI